jgi:hypothetical protein
MQGYLRNAVWIAAFACLVLGFGFVEWRVSQQPQSPHPHANQSAERPNHDKGSAEGKGDIALGSYLQKYSTYCAAKPDNENEKWHHDFWCEFKVTDFVIAAFTAILATATISLIVVGICLACTRFG